MKINLSKELSNAHSYFNLNEKYRTKDEQPIWDSDSVSTPVAVGKSQEIGYPPNVNTLRV